MPSATSEMSVEELIDQFVGHAGRVQHRSNGGERQEALR